MLEVSRFHVNKVPGPLQQGSPLIHIIIHTMDDERPLVFASVIKQKHHPDLKDNREDNLSTAQLQNLGGANKL